MPSYRTQIEVDAPPAEACAYLADHRHAADWDPMVVSSELAGDGVVAAGSAFDAEVTFYGRRLPMRYVLADHDCPGRLTFDVSGKRVEGRLGFTIEPSGAGSRVGYQLDIELTGIMRFLGRGLGAAMDGIGEKAADGIRRALTR